jgi:L-seryl-tRNA(Ser) seleniumtransferase
MNPADLLKNLPSLSEIAEHPQVKSVVDKLGHSTVATQVRGVVDDLRREIKQRAGEFSKLTTGEVIDRVAKRLSGAPATSVTSVINATGRLWGGEWSASPLSDAALDRMRLLGSDYLPSTASGARLLTECHATLKQLTSAPAAHVATSRAAALALALRTAAGFHRRTIIAKGEVGEVATGLRLRDLTMELHTQLVEVGAAHHASLADYEAAVGSGDALILKLQPESYEVVGAAPPVSVSQLAELAKRTKSTLLVDVGGAPLTDAPALPGVTAISAATAIAAGATLVVVRGEGLLGGPQCGIVLGGEAEIAKLSGHPLAALSSVEPRILLALDATLAAYQADTIWRLPLHGLLDTPLDNLRTRAERLAPQIAASGKVSGAAVRELAAHQSPQPTALGALPSWAIALTPRDETPQQLADRLAGGSISLCGRIAGDAVLLDLRTVFPRQDLSLTGCFAAGAGNCKVTLEVPNAS